MGHGKSIKRSNNYWLRTLAGNRENRKERIKKEIIREITEDDFSKMKIDLCLEI